MSGPTMAAREWGLLIFLSLIWGGSFFFTEVALRDLGPFTIVSARVSIAALALLVFVYLTGNRMPGDLKTWIAFFIMGGLNNMIPFSLIVWGQTRIDSGLASILNATTPFFAVGLTHLLTTDEKMSVNKIIGVLSGLVGVAVLISPDALRLDGEAWGKIAILGAAISYSFAGIFGKRLSRLPTSVAAAGMLTGSSVMMIPVMFVFENPLGATPGPATWVSVIAIALLCTSLAYLIYFHILAKAGATNLLLVTFLVPVSAVMLGVLILGERLNAHALIGMGMIFFGLAAVDGRLLDLIKRRSTF